MEVSTNPSSYRRELCSYRLQIFSKDSRQLCLVEIQHSMNSNISLTASSRSLQPTQQHTTGGGTAFTIVNTSPKAFTQNLTLANDKSQSVECNVTEIIT